MGSRVHVSSPRGSSGIIASRSSSDDLPLVSWPNTITTGVFQSSSVAASSSDRGSSTSNTTLRASRLLKVADRAWRAFISSPSARSCASAATTSAGASPNSSRMGCSGS